MNFPESLPSSPDLYAKPSKFLEDELKRQIELPLLQYSFEENGDPRKHFPIYSKIAQARICAEYLFPLFRETQDRDKWEEWGSIRLGSIQYPLSSFYTRYAKFALEPRAATQKEMLEMVVSIQPESGITIASSRFPDGSVNNDFERRPATSLETLNTLNTIKIPTPIMYGQVWNERLK